MDINGDVNYLNEKLSKEYYLKVFKPNLFNVYPRSFLVSDLPVWRVKVSCLLLWVLQMIRYFNKLHRVFYLIYYKDLLIHYTIVTSKYAKFPFMKVNDLIIGPSRTRKEYMRQGLQSFTLTKIIHDNNRSFGLWYVTDETNIPPRRCVEKIGFLLKARGHRKKSWIDKYVIDPSLDVT